MLMFSSYYMQLLAPGSHPHKDEISPRAISIFRKCKMNDIIISQLAANPFYLL